MLSNENRPANCSHRFDFVRLIDFTDQVMIDDLPVILLHRLFHVLE